MNSNYGTCTRCGANKNFIEFYRNKIGSGGRTHMCINCIKVHHKNHPLFAQFVIDRKILLHAGEVISNVNSIEKAELYANRNNLTLDIAKNVKKLFNQ
jgi:hypothetical protein